MASVVQSLYAKKLITPPKWLESNIHLETEMGSVAYGVSGGNSDIDIYGFVIPPLDDLFPHMRGEIPGFGTQHNRFEQYQEHHVKDGNLEYDLSIYSITKYFQLCMENNPNMVDSLFTPINCVRHITKIGQMVRDQRKIFLHKGSFHKFRGYLYSQLNKMHNGRQGKRQELIEKYSFDTKFASHAVRLGLECEQILETGDLNLQRDKELIKVIRNGEWTEDRIRDWVASKEKHWEELYATTKLPNRPDEAKIKQLLIDCLEEHYGRIRVKDAFGSAVFHTDVSELILADLHRVIEKYRN